MNDGCLAGFPDLTLPLGQMARAKYGTTTLFCPPGITLTGSSTGSITAGRRRYLPVVVPPGSFLTVTGLTVEITTAAAAGKLFRISLYTATPNWQPDKLIVESGPMAADAAAAVRTAPVFVQLPPGNYLLGFVSDAAPSFRFVSAYVPSTSINPVVGTTPGISAMEDTVSGYGSFPYLGIPWDTPSYATSGMPYFLWLTVAT